MNWGIIKYLFLFLSLCLSVNVLKSSEYGIEHDICDLAENRDMDKQLTLSVGSSISVMNAFFDYVPIGYRNQYDIGFNFGKHSIYIGPNILYDRSSFDFVDPGFQCAYQYQFQQKESGISYFIRYSIYYNRQVIENYGKVSGYYYSDKNLFSNVLSVGLDKKLGDHFSLYGDIGVGLKDGREVPVLMLNAGLKYCFNS